MFSKDNNIFAEYKKQKLQEMEKTIKVSVDDDEEEKVEAETDGEEGEGQGSEMDDRMVELQKARIEKEKQEAALKEKLRKKIAELAAKYPKGSTWFCDKVNKKVKVLDVGDGIIKVGNGNKTLDCKPSDLSAVKEDRDYKKEYANYGGKPEQIKRRSARNKARKKMENRKGIKGKDVHHKDNNPLNNDPSNLSIVSKSYNRAEPRKR